MRWWELLPEAVLVAGLGLFAVTEPSAARSGLESRKAVALMVVTALLWIGARFVLHRSPRRRVLRFVVFAIAALAVLKVVVFPAYSNTTVVEASPISTVAIRSAPLHGINHRA